MLETVPVALWVVIVLVLMALAFDFMNGFHDAANSIATVVSTGVLRPAQAVVFAAFFNFVAIFIFHLSVAATLRWKTKMAIKLNAAANITACAGRNTPVDTTVAMELAAS